MSDQKSKKHKKFFIKDILDLEKTTSDYVNKIDFHTEFNEKFKLIKCKTKFAIESLPDELI